MADLFQFDSLDQSDKFLHLPRQFLMLLCSLGGWNQSRQLMQVFYGGGGYSGRRAGG